MKQTIEGTTVNIYKGQIVTCDEKNIDATYLAEQDGRIVFVGERIAGHAAGAAGYRFGQKGAAACLCRSARTFFETMRSSA